MKTRLILALLLCQYFVCTTNILAQAHSSYVNYKSEKCPAVSIKINAPTDVTKIVLEEQLKNSGVVIKGKSNAGFKIYENIIFEPFCKEYITLYTIVENLSDTLAPGCVVSLLIKKMRTNTFVNESNDAVIVDKVKNYLNDLEKTTGKTFLEVRISDQEKLLEKIEKQVGSLEKDSAYIARQLTDFGLQSKETAKELDEKREELKTQQLILNELLSKKKK